MTHRGGRSKRELYCRRCKAVSPDIISTGRERQMPDGRTQRQALCMRCLRSFWTVLVIPAYFKRVPNETRAK